MNSLQVTSTGNGAANVLLKTEGEVLAMVATICEVDSNKEPLTDLSKRSAKARNFNISGAFMSFVVADVSNFKVAPTSIEPFLKMLPDLKPVETGNAMFNAKALNLIASAGYDIEYVKAFAPRNKRGKITTRQVKALMS